MSPNKFLPSLVCGFGAAVITTVPEVKSIGCCLVLPLAGGLTIFLFHKANNIKSKIAGLSAIKLGLMTGAVAAVFATIFEVIFTKIFHSNSFIEALPQIETMLRSFNLGSAAKEAIQIYSRIAAEIRTNGFSLIYTIYVFIGFGFLYTIFGAIGAVIGASLFNRRLNQHP